MSREDESRIGAFYRERWENVADGEMPPDVGERIFRAIRRRMNDVGRRRIAAGLARYAAAVLAGAAVSTAVHLSSGRAAPDAELAKDCFTVFSDKGQRSNATLPDGTKVWLNSHSKITYPRDYGVCERVLSLTGEAYFEVAKDSAKRFLVNAGEMTVEALGTAFNVKAYDEDREIVTTLFSGSAQATVSDRTLTLKPEQYATFDRERRVLTSRTAENVSYAAMWRDNELSFDRQTMDEIAVMFNRLYNVTIHFESERIRHYRFSGVIKNNSLDNVIEIISLTAPVSYRCVGDTVYLSEKK